MAPLERSVLAASKPRPGEKCDKAQSFLGLRSVEGLNRRPGSASDGAPRAWRKKTLPFRLTRTIRSPRRDGLDSSNFMGRGPRAKRRPIHDEPRRRPRTVATRPQTCVTMPRNESCGSGIYSCIVAASAARLQFSCGFWRATLLFSCASRLAWAGIFAPRDAEGAPPPSEAGRIEVVGGVELPIDRLEIVVTSTVKG